MSKKKYELIKEEGCNLFRIKALRDFGNVKVGDLGGLIGKEENLSHDGNCWVYDNAKVYGNARVHGDAGVYSDARVYDSAIVYGIAIVYGYTRVYGYAKVYGNARVYGNAEVSGNAKVYGFAEVCDSTKVSGYTSEVGGNARVYGNAVVCSNASISSTTDYLTISPIGSENGILTAYRTSDGGIDCTRGCFVGTLEELSKAVKCRHGNNKYGKQYARVIKYIKEEFDMKEGNDL